MGLALGETVIKEEKPVPLFVGKISVGPVRVKFSSSAATIDARSRYS
jgi:hypothetical protein